MTEQCRLCGARALRTVTDGRRCEVCGWRWGDVPDGELAPPRVDVVYYLRHADRIKIGTSQSPRARLQAIRHEELLAFERGDRHVERARHREFADLREGGEWFTSAPELLTHIASLRTGDPWDALARWIAEAYAERDGFPVAGVPANPH